MTCNYLQGPVYLQGSIHPQIHLSAEICIQADLPTEFYPQAGIHLQSRIYPQAGICPQIERSICQELYTCQGSMYMVNIPHTILRLLTSIALYFKIYYQHVLCMKQGLAMVCMVCHGVQVKVRGQVCAVSSLLLWIVCIKLSLPSLLSHLIGPRLHFRTRQWVCLGQLGRPILNTLIPKATLLSMRQQGR